MDRGVDHGFSTPTDDDHRAWLWTASLLSLIYALLTAGARITSKWGLFWYDDAILAIGYVCRLEHGKLCPHDWQLTLAVGFRSRTLWTGIRFDRDWSRRNEQYHHSNLDVGGISSTIMVCRQIDFFDADG